MKKLIFLSLLTLAFTNQKANAQNENLPNGTLESWVNRGLYSDPANWHSLNYFTKYGYDETVTMTTDAQSGNAALLETKAGSQIDLPGILSSGFLFDTLSMNSTPDFNRNLVSFHSRPVSFEMYYKAPSGNDTVAVFMLLTKWNIAQNRRDTVGLAQWSSIAVVNNYTKLSIPFIYNTGAIPDSASVLISSSKDGFNAIPGSKLYVDDISLNYGSSGVGEQLFSQLSAFPNPVKDRLNYTPVKGGQLKITDLQGRELLTTSADPGSVSLIELPPAVYVLQLVSADGSTQVSRRIVKQ